MNKIFTYLMFLSLLLLPSCERGVIDSDYDDIIVPSEGYILFSSKVATKGELVNDMSGKDFYVLGYQYSNDTDWATARLTTKPDLFYKKQVEYRNGIWEYSNPVEWDFYSKYAFFAYYPVDGDGITISSKDYVNVPTITYELPLTGVVDPSGLKDVMTAYALNQSTKSGVVTFYFQHRLFCINISVINNDDVPYDITDLTVTFNDVAYSSIVAPLRKGDPYVDEDKKPAEGGVGDVVFSILSGEESINLPADKSIKTSLTENETLGNQDSILLIPQDSRGQNFRGTLNFKLNGVDQSASFDSPQNYIEGYKYTLTMSIIGGNVLVTMNNPVAWDVRPDINYDFE